MLSSGFDCVQYSWREKENLNSDCISAAGQGNYSTYGTPGIDTVVPISGAWEEKE